MFDFVKNLFRYKAKSLEEFVEFVKGERCKIVLVTPTQAAKNGAETACAGIIADFHYLLKLTARTPSNRKVLYQERLFQRFGSDYGVADAKERQNAAIRLFLIGEQRTQDLRTKLPGVQIDLIGPNDRPMDGEMFTKLHEDATACGVSV